MEKWKKSVLRREVCAAPTFLLQEELGHVVYCSGSKTDYVPLQSKRIRQIQQKLVQCSCSNAHKSILSFCTHTYIGKTIFL